MPLWRPLSFRVASKQIHRPFSQSVPFSATQQSNRNVDNKIFSKTLLLPKTAFPLRKDPSKDSVLQARTSEELYKWQWNNSARPLFVFHDGPPYANGDLHIGHALNKILKDIINRYNVSIGKRVHYIPGWDCHGLPIENKVHKNLGKGVGELSPVAIRAEAEAYAKSQVQSQLDQFRQLGIMADWSENWTYRTLDHNYEMRQLRVFQKMVERGLIYRHYRPVYYSPSSRSALAEAELEYKDKHVSHSVYVSFDLDLEQRSRISPALQELIGPQPSVQLLVWTTTPWTLTANMAIAVNPEMMYIVMNSSANPQLGAVIFASERTVALQDILEDMNLDTKLGEITGADLVGATYAPLFSSYHRPQGSPAPYRILSSTHVTPASGTGLVHCAPAHGEEDYHLFLSQGLIPTSSSSALLCHVDGLGCFTSEVSDILGDKAAVDIVGKEVLGDGGKAMVALLRSTGVLKKIEKIKHRYPYDWKTDKPVIVTATSQWFANLDAIKDNAISSLKDVQFYPPQSRNRLESFIRGRSEWCISRQRVWGVPIPALYHLPTNRAILDSQSLDHILSILEKKGTHHWWDGPVDEFVPDTLKVPGENASETWKKGTDTMDVWFDSGTSWSMLEGLVTDAKQGVESRRRLADVCLEGSDQHRGWFQSQLLTAIGSAPAENTSPMSPYGTLITHGMVLDEKGKKMSKSLGNIVSPMTVIHGGENKKKNPAYGAEVLRLWTATVECWHDTSIGPTVLAQCEESLRKIRNTARFILGNLCDQRQTQADRVPHSELGLAERYVMHELHKLETQALEGYSTYNFPKVMNALSHFANITLSSLYFDITKDILYADEKNSLERRAVITVFEQILDTMSSVMAPVLPHLAEEIHQTWYNGDEPVKSIFTETWTPLSSEWHDPEAVYDMNQLLAVRRQVLVLLERARREKQIGNSLEASVDIIIPASTTNHPVIELLQRHASFLKQLFIVSDVVVTEDNGLNSSDWEHTEKLDTPASSDIQVRVRAASAQKCPRCWTFTREPEHTLCGRCSDVLHL